VQKAISLWGELLRDSQRTVPIRKICLNAHHCDLLEAVTIDDLTVSIVRVFQFFAYVTNNAEPQIMSARHRRSGHIGSSPFSLLSHPTKG